MIRMNGRNMLKIRFCVSKDSLKSAPAAFTPQEKPDTPRPSRAHVKMIEKGLPAGGIFKIAVI